MRNFDWNLRRQVKLLILAIVVGLAFSYCVEAEAASAVTANSTLACVTKDEYSEAVQFIINEDMASLRAYIERGRCIILKAGVQVTITDAGFLVHEFVVQGVKLYTARENLRLR